MKLIRAKLVDCFKAIFSFLRLIRYCAEARDQVSASGNLFIFELKTLFNFL